MKLYQVQFKNGDKRIYGADIDCNVGDVVVVDSSHGQMVAEVLDELERVPRGMAEEKLRYILCRVPMEDVEMRKAERERLEEEKMAREAAEEREEKRKQRQKELLSEMRAVMTSNSRREAVMLQMFAEYDPEFRELYKEYTALGEEGKEPAAKKMAVYVFGRIGCL